jgi:hypothetical protein
MNHDGRGEEDGKQHSIAGNLDARLPRESAFSQAHIHFGIAGNLEISPWNPRGFCVVL